MATAETIGAALAEFREMLEVDGAGLELTGVQDGIVRVRLLFGAQTCEECVLSRDMLETVLLSGLKDHGIARVVVADPREGP
jgi:NifU-like domain